jgi:hypothetical protein
MKKAEKGLGEGEKTEDVWIINYSGGDFAAGFVPEPGAGF